MAISSSVQRAAKSNPAGHLPVGPSSASGHSSPKEDSVHLENYRKLIARVVDVFGDELRASRWLSLPNVDLGGKTPLQVAQKAGYELQVLDPTLTRIEHGIEL